MRDATGAAPRPTYRRARRRRTSTFVDGPAGQVAVIGSAASSRVGRLLTGSANAEIRSPKAAPSTVRAVFVAAAVAVVAVVVRALVRRRRTT